MAVRRLLLASARDALLRIPEDLGSLERYYALSQDDLELIRSRRSEENRLGLALLISAEK